MKVKVGVGMGLRKENSWPESCRVSLAERELARGLVLLRRCVIALWRRPSGVMDRDREEEEEAAAAEDGAVEVSEEKSGW